MSKKVLFCNTIITTDYSLHTSKVSHCKEDIFKAFLLHQNVAILVNILIFWCKQTCEYKFKYFMRTFQFYIGINMLIYSQWTIEQEEIERWKNMGEESSRKLRNFNYNYTNF